MDLFLHSGCLTPKFYHFHEVHHLLVEVHLVPLLIVHLDLLDGGQQWIVDAIHHIRHGAKYEHSRICNSRPTYLTNFMRSTTYS